MEGRKHKENLSGDPVPRSGVGGAFLARPAGGRRELRGILGRTPLAPGEELSARKRQEGDTGCVFALEPIKIKDLNVGKRLKKEKERGKKEEG